MELLKHPHPLLRTQSAAVPCVGKRERRLLKQMLAHMRRWKGIGLAAPQVGSLEQLIVAEVGGQAVLWANPKVLEAFGIESMKEGCLSIPEAFVDVGRATHIWVRAIDEENRNVEQRLAGLLARVVQHEIDHLQGKLIVDYGWPAKSLAAAAATGKRL